MEKKEEKKKRKKTKEKEKKQNKKMKGETFFHVLYFPILRSSQLVSGDVTPLRPKRIVKIPFS